MCFACSGALNMLPRGPKIMQIPGAYQTKFLLCRKSAILSVRWKFYLREGWGESPQKSARFSATAPA